MLKVNKIIINDHTIFDFFGVSNNLQLISDFIEIDVGLLCDSCSDWTRICAYKLIDKQSLTTYLCMNCSALYQVGVRPQLP